MRTNLAQTRFPDEEPVTKKTPSFPTPTIMLASRVDRLAELAIERLLTSPDEHTIVAACEDLAQIRALAAQVLR